MIGAILSLAFGSFASAKADDAATNAPLARNERRSNFPLIISLLPSAIGLLISSPSIPPAAALAHTRAARGRRALPRSDRGLANRARWRSRRSRARQSASGRGEVAGERRRPALSARA